MVRKENPDSRELSLIEKARKIPENNWVETSTKRAAKLYPPPTIMASLLENEKIKQNT